MTRPASTVTTTRHPATVGAFAAAAAIGAWGTWVPDGRSTALGDALLGFSVTYYAALGVGGVLGLIALCLPAQDERARAERSAWYIVGWFSLAYAVAAFTKLGAPAGQAALQAGATSVVATWRIVQVSVERRRARRDVRAGLLAEPPPPGVVDPRES